jgi:UDP-GlcNAc:undecaprenyl-phosphate GlcNAc-1-phosphate transferase
MRTLVLALCASFLVAFVVTRLVRDGALRLGLTDGPGGRKVHKAPIPRLGGVGVVCGFLAPLLGLGFYRNDISALLLDDRPLLLAMSGGVSLLGAVGLIDDLRGLPAWVKLLAQVGAGLLAWSVGVTIDAIRVPLFGVVHFGALSVVATVGWVVLVTNAVNLIDGLDGLAGAVVALATGALLVMSVVEGNALAMVLLASLLGATLGFLVYNVNPASIFLGDAGALTLGYLLAIVSVHSAQKSYALFSIGASVLIVGLPIFDLSMAVVRRALAGGSVFAADQHHVHHQLLRLGMSPRQVWILLVGAALLLQAGALTFIYADDRVSAAVIVGLAGVGALAFRFLGYDAIIRRGQRSRVAVLMEQGAAARAERVAEARSAIAAAEDLDAVWDALVVAARALEQQTIAMDVPGGSRVWDRTVPLSRRGVHLAGVVERSFPVGRDGVLRFARFREHEVFAPHDDALAQSLADAVALWRATHPDARA